MSDYGLLRELYSLGSKEPKIRDRAEVKVDM